MEPKILSNLARGKTTLVLKSCILYEQERKYRSLTMLNESNTIPNAESKEHIRVNLKGKTADVSQEVTEV